MGCLVVLLASFAPRLVLALVWIFSNLVTRAFDGFLLPLLGLIVVPMTTLMPRARSTGTFLATESGVEKSIATSTSRQRSAYQGCFSRIVLTVAIVEGLSVRRIW
jgi:hypothetical protein